MIAAMRLRNILFSIMLLAPSPVFADGVVVASIKPLHSLVAAVMEGDKNQPVLLVDGAASAHSFSLKPSQASALQKAAVVFYIGDDFELFLQKPLHTLPEKVARVPMEKLQGIVRLPVRLGHESHEGHNGEEAHAHGAYDLHIWLSPANAKIMIMEIARALAIAFPDKKELYFENVRKMGVRLDALDTEMAERMGKLFNRPFISFHDATQYFDAPYGLRFIGAITLHPERGIGAKRMEELRQRIEADNVICVFREPQFDAKVIDNLLSGTRAKSVTIDPEGALLTSGPQLYYQLIEGVAKAFESCLAP